MNNPPRSSSGFSTADETRVYAKVTARLLPYLFLFYVVSYLDRVNIGFAKLQMMADLHWSDTIYGLGAGMFFIGYFLFEMPGNLILHKVGARRWLGTIMVIWGLLSAGMMFVATPLCFYLLRFALGIAEAGFFPGIILYLTYWYPTSRRGRIIATFMTALSVSGIIGGPLSGWIMQSLDGMAGLKGWQWLFILEGLPSTLMGIWMFGLLDDSIREAKWLTEREKTLLEQNIARDHRKDNHTSLRQVFADGRVWVMCLILFMLLMGFYGIGFWLPQLIHNAGVNGFLNIGLLSAIPYGVATVVMIWVGHNSDRTGDRHVHLIILSFAGGIGMVLTGYFDKNVVLSMMALTLATASIFSTIPLAVALPTDFLSGIAAAGGIGLINSFGSLGGFVSPFLVGRIKDATHSLSMGLYAIAGCLFLAGFIVLALNRRRPADLVPDPATSPV